MKTKDAEKLKRIVERLVVWQTSDSEPLFNIIRDAERLLASLDSEGRLAEVAEAAA